MSLKRLGSIAPRQGSNIRTWQPGLSQSESSTGCVQTHTLDRDTDQTFLTPNGTHKRSHWPDQYKLQQQ